ncbi:MAG: glutathione ABC transporter permease GsiC, partial [Chloroflexi bacterium]|nr:glutathione ABC transporter permease GsiC [Chloroflexota bacterium]
MQTYFLKRLLALVPTLFSISIVVFLVMRLIPGDAISTMIGTQFILTDAQAQSLREYFGLNLPWHEQYIRWLFAALRGDFGISIRT